MKVLWFVNIPLPAVFTYLNYKSSGSGWWLSSLADEMIKEPSIKLTIANCSSIYKSFERFESGGIEYWLIPAKDRNINGYRCGKLIRKLAQLVNDSDVEIVDVHGSEYFYGQVTPFVDKPVVITIQGIVNEVTKNAFGNKTFLKAVMLQTRSIQDIKSLLGMIYNYFTMLIRSKSERVILKSNSYIIGRTERDKAITYKLNPNRRKYFVCWEIMRSEFYKTAWSYNTNQKIFASCRGGFAKGLDDLVLILPELKNKFPHIELRLTVNVGKNGYRGYLARLAKNLGVYERVKFLGYLTVPQVADELKIASVFVHPSYADNSPNALAEAMCVGTPCVASAIGGIPSMIEDKYNGLLFEAGNREQLLEKISAIISDKDLAQRLSYNARRTALERHNPAKVVRETLVAYEAVLQDRKGR